MTERQTALDGAEFEQHRAPVPDVWFSNPPEDEPLEARPQHEGGMRMLFSSPAPQART